MVPCHHTCHPASLCTLHLVLSILVLMKKTLSCARRKLKGFGHRSFSVQAPFVQNNLPPHIPHSRSLSQFKTSLKTFLFISTFPELPWSPGRLVFVCFVFMDCSCLCCWYVSERERELWEERWSEGERERERETGWERVMKCIISCVFNICTLPLHPPIPGFFLMSLVFVCFYLVLTEHALRFEPHEGR